MPPAPAAPSPIAAPTLHGNLALSLQDAIAMGLENNLNLEVQRHAPLIADEDAEIAWGAYDPEFYGETTYLDSETPNANALNAAADHDLAQGRRGQTAASSGLVPWLGASYDLSLSSSRLETNSTIQSVSPAHALDREHRRQRPAAARPDLERAVDPREDHAHPARRRARELPHAR